jgi:hypothetical protein
MLFVCAGIQEHRRPVQARNCEIGSARSRPGLRSEGIQMARIVLSVGNILVSLVLGAIAFGFVFIKYPEAMSALLDCAAEAKAWVISRGTATDYDNWMRVLLEERQLVFIGFTVVTRAALSVFTYPFGLLWERPG